MTHVISAEARRTLNLLRGIVSGCWLLSFEWIVDSLAAGEWLPEDKYECGEAFPSCVKARLDPSLASGLFASSGRGVNSSSSSSSNDATVVSRILVDKECFPSQKELTALIDSCGGALTNCLRNADVVVTGKTTVPKSKRGVSVVNPTWVLDSITNLELVPFKDYLVNEEDSSSEDGMSQEY